MRYRIETPIEYNDTEQYRQCIRALFEMDQAIYEQCIKDIENHNQEVLDDVTRDEISYDGGAAMKVMDYVYTCTKDIVEFKELYSSAAMRMFSEDPNIGIAILFSYDYLQLFHLCLVEFFSDRFNASFEPYRELVKRLH